ncbi:MAG: DNRLRE domain-containing protein [Planctomycetota bacterium]|nr:DNRLRE domain-containing protein [Planctomycetota bacterium]
MVLSKSLTLPAGTHVLRMVVDSNSTYGSTGNFDWFKLTSTTQQPPPTDTTATLTSSTGAYVRDGTYANQNFGAATELLAKRSATAGNTRESYVTFDLSSIIGDVTAAKVRLNGKLSAGGSVPIALHGVGGVAINETSLTWNNKPAAGSALATKTISGTAGAWYELDVSTYLAQLKAAGATSVTFALKAPNITDPWAIFASDENGTTANRPQLVVTHEGSTQPVQGLVVSKTSLIANEGATGSFTVRLNAQPASDVTVTVARQSGDTDLTNSPASLVFTPANWNVAQTVTVAAAQDADTTNGQATFAVSAAGLNTRTITATEADDDVVQPPPPTDTKTIAIGDASYVRGGSYGNTNFGTTTDLLVKRSASADNIRETFLKIDLSGVASVGSAKLRLHGGLSASGNVQIAVHSANHGWTEGGITYNNRPRSEATAVASKTLTSTTKSWHEFDLTSFLRAEKAAGRSIVSIVLRAPNITDPWAVFSADGAASNRPEVVIQSQQPTDALSQQLDAARVFAQQQLRNTVDGLANNAYPQYTLADGSWKLENENHWTAGSLPGALWQLHGRTGETFWRDQATARTLPLAGQASKIDDLTFRILNSYRPLYEGTGSSSHRQVLLNAAASKNTQWNETVGAFRTPWRRSDSGDPRANFGVLLDQSMDMELMFWAARETGNQQYYDRAVRHLRTVAEHVVRADGGSYHWVYFHDQTGEFVSGETYQGYADESTWARGQAWGIYSFAMAYRETGFSEFMTSARKLADYFVSHLPADNVPFWDFDDPAAPNTFRDTSAAAVAASAMLEMSQLLRADGSVSAADTYLAEAKATLSSLSSAAYLAQGTASDGVLLHGALNVPTNTGSDSSLIFGDYYFLEAINRYAALA